MNKSAELENEAVDAMGRILIDSRRPLKQRFRALFALKNLGGKSSIKWIENCIFSDDSALLKHECAYCLGQMGDPAAVPGLERVLKDSDQDVIVRHEAGEALAAIGLPSSLALLKEYQNHPVREIAETCELAVQKMSTTFKLSEVKDWTKNPYQSVDPTPPLTDKYSVPELEKMLLDDNLALFDRYRAMFTLRNLGSKAAILALAKGLKCGSALFKHEIAYVLGQIQSDACEDQLAAVLRDVNEHEMVRHECAEALGSIASSQCEGILRDYIQDTKRVVRESCEVALDMCDYENSSEFQFVDTLLKTE